MKTLETTEKRFDAAFADRLAAHRLAKKVLRQGAQIQSLSASAEARELERRDVDAGACAAPINAADPVRLHRHRNMTFEQLRAATRGATASMPSELRVGRNDYADARIQRSGFCVQLTQMRQQACVRAQEINDRVHRACEALKFIFNDAERRATGVLACPKADFGAQVKKLRSETAASLAATVRLIEEGLLGIVDLEPAVRAQRTGATRSVCDRDTQVEAQDLHSAVEQEQSRRVRSEKALEALRKQQQRDATSQQERLECEQHRTQALVTGVFQLHDAVYDALHTVYRHRFPFAARCPNHFSNVRRDCASDQAVRHVLDASQRDIELLRVFRNYFLASETFGVNLKQSTASHNDENTLPRTAGEKDTEQTCENRPTSAQPRTFGRMESWHRKQTGLWKARRESCAQGIPVPVVQYDPSVAPSAPTPRSTAAFRRHSIS